MANKVLGLPLVTSNNSGPQTVCHALHTAMGPQLQNIFELHVTTNDNKQSLLLYDMYIYIYICVVG